MSITIQSPAASVTSIALRKTQNVVNESMTRLATGKQLNGAKDNVVGLNAQTSLMAEIRGLTQASKNAGIGIAINDAADAALAETTFILQRMRELAVQGASTAITATTRSALGIEVSALYGVISNLAADTKYNGQALLDGTFASEVVQIGPNATNGSVTYSLSSIAPASLGAYVSEGYTRVPVTAASSEPVNNTTISEDFMVDSTSIDAVANETAKDVAAKINAVSGTTNVFATAETYAHLLSTSASSENYTVEINGTETASFAISSTSVSGAVTAVNAISSTTGVTATATSDFKVLLHDADGDDITIQNNSASFANLDVYAVQRDGVTTQGSVATDLAVVSGNSATRVVGTLRLTSDEAFTVTQSGTATQGYLVTGTAARSAVSSVDLSTAVKSIQAIETIDSAINQVASIRATAAANSQVFEHSISGNMFLQDAKKSGLAAIEDADYAVETARLAKAMMLREVSSTLLAQANTNEELVLMLLGKTA